MGLFGLFQPRYQSIGPETIQNYPGVVPYSAVPGPSQRINYSPWVRPIQGPTNQTQSAALQPTRTVAPTTTTSAPQQSEPTTPTQPSGPSAEDLLNQAYGDYESELNRQLNESLPESYQSQQEQIRSLYGSSQDSLKAQQDIGLRDIESSQTKSLNDLADNIQMMFRTGNAMLGVRGSSDSSAASAMSAAITRLGSRQRGDIMEQMADRLFKLQTTYNSENQRLQTEMNNKISALGDWFRTQQDQLRGLQAGIQVQKSQQLLQYAMQNLQAIQSEEAAQKQALTTWAVNHSNSIDQVMKYMSTFSANLPTFQSLSSGITGGNTSSNNLFGYGVTSEDKQKLFGL